MNLLSQIRLLRGRKTNPVLKKVDELRQHPIFKRARFDLYTPSSHPERLVILLGQVHTVWRGKIGNRERKMIVNCQARLCSYYAYFESVHGIRSFGGEGLYEGLNTGFHDERSFELYRGLEKSLQISHPISLEQLPKVARSIFDGLGKEWQYSLRSPSDLKTVQKLAGAVSGQTLFDYLRDGQIHTYPVEGEAEYQRVLEGVNRLGAQIEKLQQSSVILAIRQRGGKIMSQEELGKVQELNALVKEFNRVIGSDIRERATLEILKQKSDLEPMVIFTMGVGHRRNYLSLARRTFGNTNTAFLFITPPELLMNLWVVLGIPVVILAALLAGLWIL